jgi:hypothetical protein
MHTTVVRSVPIGALVASAVACGGLAPVSSSMRDSAGVVIAETPAAALSTAPVWRVSGPPVLQIGAVEGDPARQFAGIEGIRQLPDGRLAVADRGSAEIRFFDDRGHHLESYGRPGDAPGEYRLLIGLGSGPGDSLWAYDFGLRRFTILAPRGVVARTLSVRSALAAVTAVGRLRDGSFVIREQWSGSMGATPRTGLVRDPAAVVRLSSDGAMLDTIALVPGREVFLGSEDGRAVMSAPMLAHNAAVAMNDSLVFVGDQSDFEVRAYDIQGALTRIIRLTGLDLTAGPDERLSALEAAVDRAPAGERAALRAHLSAMTVPSTRPAYGPLLVDDAGNLWVGSYEHAGPSRFWTVFGPDGSLRATVPVPPRFQLLQVARRRAIGAWRDTLDVEYVRVYAISPDRSSGRERP